MDNSNTVQDAREKEAFDQPGPSRPRRRSTSSSSSSSSTESSSSDSSKRKRKRRHRHHKRSKRARRSDARLEQLFKEVSDLRYHLENKEPQIDLDDCISLDHESLDQFFPVTSQVMENVNPIENIAGTLNDSNNFLFDIETKLKDPTIPKSTDVYLNILNNVQHFNSNEWSEVRYADTQKNYCRSPGFVELDANDEIKGYDTLRNLVHNERAYAAMSFCLIKQRECSQNAVKDLLNWLKSPENLNYDLIQDKVIDLFQKGDFTKVSSDLLQLICGHRAETIQMRRDGITNHIRDPLVKAAVRKIAPSHEHLFNADQLTATLEKAGGVKKAFMPLHRSNASASQAAASVNRTAPHPSQGSVDRFVPSQGNFIGGTGHSQFRPYYRGPTQGEQMRPPQGYTSDNRRGASNSRGSFRARPGRQNRHSDQFRSNRRFAAPVPNAKSDAANKKGKS
ncbi:hypothetical protein ABMA27_013334 [Loxostege sticticalis]|uniref:Uncharacterized protein n=1 Tax=Loxostege sticticalis TaxID=481309 RepID=A0ABR3IEW0_LOXSC